MTTSEMVTFIQKQVTNYTREEILEFYNRVNEFVLHKPLYQRMKLDGTNGGFPPFLATQNNVYEYECPSDCWRTVRVFSERLQRSFASRNFVTRNRLYYFTKQSTFEIAVRSFDATETEPGRVIFDTNPGDTTEQFYHLYLLKARQLTSEQIQTELPVVHHLYMRYGTLALIRDEEYGNGAFMQWVNDKQSGAKQIWYQLNKGDQGRLFRTIIREEFQELGPYYNYS